MHLDEQSRHSGFIIWVDGDACPGQARELLWRTAVRRHVGTVFVANTPLYLPPYPELSFQLVPSGPDMADDYIVEHSSRDDIVVTGDIPLAARLVERSVCVLNPRGEEWNEANIGERLAMRNLMEELRSAGLPTGGPSEYGQSDRQRFANALDRAVAKRMKKN